MTPEGRVKEQIKRVLRSIDAWFFMPVPSGRGVAGVPDFIACVPTVITQEMVGKTIGVFVAIEAKAPGKEKTATANQLRQIDGIQQAGGCAGVVSDIETLEPLLEKITC